MGMFLSSLGRSSGDSSMSIRAGMYHLHVGVTDCRHRRQDHDGADRGRSDWMCRSRRSRWSGATRTRCPYSVGESGSRTTVHTGQAVVEAAKDLKSQIATKGMPKGNDMLTATADSNPTRCRDAARYTFVAHFAEVEVDTETGRVHVTKFVAAHDSGRIINPLTADSQVKGGATTGIGMALHEELLYDRAHRPAADRRLLRRAHHDAPGRAGNRSDLRSRPTTPTVLSARRRWASRPSFPPWPRWPTRSSTPPASASRILPMTRDKVLGVLA